MHLQHHYIADCLVHRMLCREQRTALTTAKARSQLRRDQDQLVRRLCPSPSDAGLARGRRPHHPRASSPPSFSDCFNPAVLLPNLDNLSVDTRTSPAISDSISAPERRKTFRHSRTYHTNFREVFTWVCLLGLIRFACAAPFPKNMDTVPLWIDPCGGGTTDESLQQEETAHTNQIVFEPTKLEAKSASDYARSHRNEYVNHTFKVDFDEHHSSWNQANYDWLPNENVIHKKLGDNLSASQLQKLQNDIPKALADIYEYLQRIAVGLEQVEFDIKQRNGRFHIMFERAKLSLRNTLCELHTLMTFNNFERRADITRDIMGSEYRNMDADSDRNLRDWIIYRDYMNVMEYVTQAFEFFGSQQ